MANKATITSTKYLILGGGVTGLTCANFFKDCLVIEKEERVGGYCKTIKKGDFVFDYSGHFFHFKNPEWRNFFLEKIPKDDIIHQTKNTKIFFKGKLIDYPFQTNIHELDKPDFINCLYDLFTKEEKASYDNFLDMLYGKFGKSITEFFLKPYNEKLYATSLDKLDKDAMGRFFPYANIDQIIRNMKESTSASYNDEFLYPKDGAEAFVKVLSNQIDKKQIKTNSLVTKIDLDQKYIIVNHGQKIAYDYLINTLPLNVFLELTGDKSDLKNRLSYNKVLVFNLGFDRPSPKYKEHWIYVPNKHFNFYRIGFYNNILQQEKLSLYIEIGFNKESQPDIEKELSQALSGLKEMGVIDKDFKLLESEAILMDPAYVHIETQTAKEIDRKLLELNSQDAFSIGRYGRWTYCSIEDCLEDAKETFEKITTE